MLFSLMKMSTLLSIIHRYGGDDLALRCSTRVTPPLLILLLFSTFAAPAAAHGADTYWVIVRESHTDPTVVSTLLNDTIEFNNVIDRNLTISADVDGDGLTNGSGDASCIAPVDSYCGIWLDSLNWSVGIHLVEVEDDSGLMHRLNLSISADSHPSEESPGGYSFGEYPGADEISANIDTAGNADSPSILIQTGIVVALMWVAWLGMVARNSEMG